MVGLDSVGQNGFNDVIRGSSRETTVRPGETDERFVFRPPGINLYRGHRRIK